MPCPSHHPYFRLTSNCCGVFGVASLFSLLSVLAAVTTKKVRRECVATFPQEPWATVMEKRLHEAQLYKEEGNQRYREGKYRDAVSRYHRALLQLRGLDPSLPSPLPNLGPQGPALTPEQENILHTTQTDCYNNLADANIRRYLQLTQSELSSYHRKEKQLYLGMFD
nr:tetratricopeptide repeat protein 9C isoform X2 [Symphalangus syndactylus]